MNNQNIQVLKKQFKKILFKYSDDESRIKLILKNSQYEDFIQIISYLGNNQSQLMGEQLYYLNQLIGLDIQFKEQQLTIPQPIIIFSQNLQYLISLNYLFITIFKQDDCNNLNKGLVEMGKGLKQLKDLKLLSLSLYEISELGVDGAIQLNQSLKELKHLSNLQYRLFFQNKENDIKILQELYNGFQYLENIINFQMTLFRNSSIQGEGLKMMSINLKHLINLKFLTLNIEQDQFITYEGVEILKESILSLKNLTHLYLTYYDQKVQASHIFRLQEGLFESENLEVLEATYYFYINQDEQYIVGSNIKINSKIQELKLRILNMNTSHKYNTLMFDKNFQNLSNLISLHIETVNINVIDKRNNRSDYLINSQKLTFLKITIIGYASCQFIWALGFCLPLQKNLNHLELNIQIQEHIKNDGDLLSGISQLHQLQKLNMKLKFNYIGIKGLYDIANCYSKLQNLNELIIFDTSPSTMTSQIEQIGQSMQYLNKLTKLEINLSNPDYECNLEEFSKGMIYLFNLKSFKLNYQIDLSEAILTQKQILNIMDGIKCLKQLNTFHFSLSFEEEDISVIAKYMIDTIVQLEYLRELQIQSILNLQYCVYQIVKRKHRRLITTIL